MGAEVIAACAVPMRYDCRMTNENDEAHSALQRLLDQLDVTQTGTDTFEGAPGEGWRRLFGGHVAAQAVIAAYRTVSDGAIHSFHSYFVRAGSHDEPIRYVVKRIRDGRTFTTRDVVAYQSDEAIFNLSCSFAKPEEGVSRGPEPPDVPGPEGLPPWNFGMRARPEDRARMLSFDRDSALEIRAVDGDEPPPGGVPRRRVWMGLRGTMPEDPVLHAALLTYASDRGFIMTAHAGAMSRRPQQSGAMAGAPMDAARMGASASLDHSIWFHRTPRFDDWLLFTSESPVAHAARALILGQVYRRDGVQVATVVQEALIRPPRLGAPS